MIAPPVDRVLALQEAVALGRPRDLAGGPPWLLGPELALLEVEAAIATRAPLWLWPMTPATLAGK